MGKTVIYFIVIGLTAAFLIYFYSSLSSDDPNQDLAEVISQPSSGPDIQEDMDLELLQEEKFINLRKGEDERTYFKAGRRNPFEPYD